MGEPDLTSLIEACYSAALDPAIWTQVLDSISTAIGAKGVVIVSHNPARTASTLASEGLEAANAAYRDVWWRFDTRIAKARALGSRPDRVVTDAGLITPDEKRRDPFFQDFSARYGLGDLAAYPIIDPVDRCLLSVSAFRDIRRGAYAADDIARLQMLAPHVVRAFEMTARIADVTRRIEDVLSALDRMRFGIVLLDGGGRLRHANTIAEGLMPAYLHVDAGRHPRAVVASERPKLDRLVASALPGAKAIAETTLLLRGTGAVRPLFVEVMPLKPGDAVPAPFVQDAGGVLMTLRDLFARPSRENTGELVALGLTRGEARVALLVGRGHSPREAADALHIAEGTVRVQLRSCFAKLGLNRQSELAVLVTRLDDGVQS